jgi:protein-tyrosine phosphatase
MAKIGWKVAAGRVAPEGLVVEPPVLARAERLSNGRYHLTWTPQSDQTAVYLATDPNRLLLMVVGEKTAVTPPIPHTPRPYFHLHFLGGPADGLRLPLAERFLPVPSSFNFRDIGGYATENGRLVRWGQVYRSGSLAALSPEDQAYLQGLGLRLVCDLRSPGEVKQAPDCLPDDGGMVAWQRPLRSQESNRQQVRVLRQHRQQMDALLLRVYTEMIIEENASQVGEILTAVADEGKRPLLIHCAAGKDRTGMVIALLLLLLGVPEETVLADYSLSNLAHKAIQQAMRRDMRQVLWVGMRPAQLYPLLLADPATLRAALATVRQRYSTVEAYLCGPAGMQPETLAALRAALLTPPE